MTDTLYSCKILLAASGGPQNDAQFCVAPRRLAMSDFQRVTPLIEGPFALRMSVFSYLLTVLASIRWDNIHFVTEPSLAFPESQSRSRLASPFWTIGRPRKLVPKNRPLCA